MREVSGIIVFSIKSLIVSILFFSVVAMLLPDLKEVRQEWKDFSSNRENRALVLSFIQNPVALTISGERDLEHNNFDDAALKFELAVGLLEMHGASPATIRPYQLRFAEARKLAEQSTAKK